MKLKRCIALLAVLLAVSCKKETPIDELPLERPEITETPVQITAEMTVEKDDVFELFCIQDSLGNFRPDKSIRIDVLGRPESQIIRFNLPDDTHVTNLRLDPGQNPEQGKITVTKFTIKQHDKKLDISGAEFFKYFSYNEAVKGNPGNAVFELHKVNDVYDPIVYPNGELMEKLKMFK